MLTVIGMGLLLVDAVERRPNPPTDLSAHPLSSPPPSPHEHVREEDKDHCENGEL
jgi:hypothetical protein